MNSQPLSDSEVSTVTTLWEISFRQPRVFLSFRERKMSFWFFFILKTRVIFLGLCKKRSPRNNHVMDFQFISIRRHIYEGFPSWIELEENFRLKPRKNLQHKYDNSVTLWLWLCWKPPRLQLKSKPWYDLPEKLTLIKRQPKISLGIFFHCFCVCVRKNIYKNCWLKFCRVQAVRRAWTHRDNKRNSGLFFFFLDQLFGWTSALRLWRLWNWCESFFWRWLFGTFFFSLLQRERVQRGEIQVRDWNKSFQTIWTELVANSVHPKKPWKFKQHVIQDLQGFFLWINNQLQTLKMTLFAKK